MEQASRPGAAKRRGAKRGRGSTREWLTVTQEVVLRAEAPVGSHFNGYEDVLVQNLHLAARVIRFRRERWLTPAGETLLATLPASSGSARMRCAGSMRNDWSTSSCP